MTKTKVKESKSDAGVEMYHDKILVVKIDLEVRTAGGLIMGSEVEKDRETAYGKVIAVGQGKAVDTLGLIPMKTNVGDIIAFNERIPRRVMHLGKMYYTLRETDVDFKVTDTNVSEKPYQLEGYEYDSSIAKTLN